MVAPSAVERLVLRRELAAPPATVFDYWTNPEHMKKWFGPSVEYSNPIVEVDLRPGGRYRIAFQAESTPERIDIVGGEFLAIEPPHKLVYTWQWEETNEHAGVHTQVTVEFQDAAAGTLLILTHEMLCDQEMRDSHEKGWTGALGRLEDQFPQ